MKDLTKTTGTYSKLINDNITTIYEATNNIGCTAEMLKQLVKDIVAPANDTPAKANFLRTLDHKRTKNDIAFYVTDSMLCGAGMGVSSSFKRYQ